jgi:hypothetical protein
MTYLAAVRRSWRHSIEVLAAIMVAWDQHAGPQHRGFTVHSWQQWLSYWQHHVPCEDRVNRLERLCTSTALGRLSWGGGGALLAFPGGTSARTLWGSDASHLEFGLVTR